MFKKLEGDTAVIRENGVYKVSELYEYRGDLYLKYGSGFVRMYADAKTTKAGVHVDCIQTDAPLFRDRFGRISLLQQEGYTPLFVTSDGALQLPDKPKE